MQGSAILLLCMKNISTEGIGKKCLQRGSKTDVYTAVSTSFNCRRFYEFMLYGLYFISFQETYGRWAGLRYRVEDALDRGDGDLRALADHRTTTTDLRSLKDYTDTLVR